ncbi:nucleoside recognition domain-containing protein [Rhizobium anhuiense]|nr:nucleoside recognition domain-containing protein [Rhizobium anhuiense]
MQAFIDVITRAGHSALDVALYTLLPIMVVMTIALRLLEVYGVLDRLVIWLTPVVRPFGLTGLAALAILQSSLISFVAPLPTLRMMENRGVSKRHLATALAAVFATAPANATYPLGAYGLSLGSTMLFSVIGAIAAASATYWVFGCRMDSSALVVETSDASGPVAKRSLMSIINVSGGQAVQSIIGIIPMLMVSLAVVFGLQQVGVVAWIVDVLGAPLSSLGIDSAYILPVVTKYLAGNTAMVALFHDMAKQSALDPLLVQKGSGFLINPLDLSGIGIFLGAGPRIASVLLPAVAGGLVGIALRTAISITIW